MTAGPKLTAILACRNAAGTLGALLDHFERHGAEVLVIDNGSTDATVEIAAARGGRPVADIVTLPFDGTFDLTRQLRCKRDLVRAAGSGWIVHADADEFLDPHNGETLAAVVRRLDPTGAVAVACRERLFLPAYDDERHRPEDFPLTLRRYVPIADRDPKQRLFRQDADLDLWLATGGHTVTADAAGIADEVLDLRHYIGLSLDDIRAQYHGRVHAPGDLAKLWHLHRIADDEVDIVAPGKEALAHLDRPERRPGADRALPPVFVRRKPEHVAPPPGLADLVVVAARTTLTDAAVRRIGAALPGLRIEVAERTAGIAVRRRGLPVLHLTQHPASVVADLPEVAAVRAAAVDWLRRVAGARRVGLAPGGCYLELRVEDLEAGEVPDLGARIGAMLIAAGPFGIDGFLPSGLARTVAPDWPDPVRTIAGPLARDLGYG